MNDFDYSATSQVFSWNDKDRVLNWVHTKQMNASAGSDEKGYPIIKIPMKEDLKQYQIVNIGDTISYIDGEFIVKPHGKTMTVGELRDQIDDLSDDDRSMWLKRLIDILSPISLNTMNKASERFWNGLEKTTVEEDWIKFKAMQNKAAKICINLEVTSIGKVARESLGLPPFTLETQL